MKSMKSKKECEVKGYEVSVVNWGKISKASLFLQVFSGILLSLEIKMLLSSG